MLLANQRSPKDHIGAIAGEIIFAKGFQGSALHEIAAKGCISKAGIYHHFKTKEDILLYILLKNTALGIHALEKCRKQNAESGVSAFKALNELIKTYASFLLEHRKNSLIVLRERHQLSGANKRLLLSQERNVFLLLKHQLRNTPEIKKELDVNLIAFQIMAVVHWMGYWFDERGGLSRQEAIDQTIDIIFHGMLAKSG